MRPFGAPPKKHTNHRDGHPALFVRQTSALATFQRRKDRYRPSFGVPTQAACDEGRRLPACRCVMSAKRAPSAPSSSASTPNDAAALRTLLRSMGVDNYEPRVLHQLLEYMHSYCAEIFADSSLYAEHAGRPGQLECEDVQLSARLKAQASQSHAPLLMEQMARSRNSKSIAAPTVPNIQLPNLKLCLVEENWQLEPRVKRQATASNGGAASSAAEGSGASSGGPGRPAAPSALSSGRVAFALPARSSSGASQQQPRPQSMETGD